MTSQDHNKVLGVLHLVYGGANAFVMLMMTVYFAFIWSMMSRLPMPPPAYGGDPFPKEMFGFIFAAMAVMMVVFTIIFAVPQLIAGYGLLKRKKWARKAGIVASALAALGFPLGTALSVYSFWFLFGQGDELYKNGGKASVAYLHELPKPAPDWAVNNANNKTSEREREYVPPTQPPDWRG
ncbi:MAG: hypothetical protein ACR2LC_06495 [Pyrinomonadaceae bacterium]